LVDGGLIRVNHNRVAKCSHVVKADDVITLTLHDRIRVVKVKGEAPRRGPASVASTLYEEIDTC
jgi:ribosome-associated heat shock protein Hsp15